MKPKCELCHQKEATQTAWVNAEDSPIKVGGIYRVCDDCAANV